MEVVGRKEDRQDHQDLVVDSADVDFDYVDSEGGLVVSVVAKFVTEA